MGGTLKVGAARVKPSTLLARPPRRRNRIGAAPVELPRGGATQTSRGPFIEVTMLHVYTARLGRYRGPDALNITRGSGRDRGLVFAPSRALLDRSKQLQRDGTALVQTAQDDVQRLDGDWLLAMAWGRYYAAYCQEMRRSRAAHPAVWSWILGLERIVLLCYCTSAHCHRAILGRAILPSLGARFGGEILE